MEYLRQRIMFCPECNKKRFHYLFAELNDDKSEITRKQECKCGITSISITPTYMKILTSEFNTALMSLETISEMTKTYTPLTMDSIRNTLQKTINELEKLRDSGVSIY